MYAINRTIILLSNLNDLYLILTIDLLIFSISEPSILTLWNFTKQFFDYSFPTIILIPNLNNLILMIDLLIIFEGENVYCKRNSMNH